MKVEKSQAFFPCNPAAVPAFAGIPIRLHIASQILPMIVKFPGDVVPKTAQIALQWADALIDAHNEDQK